MCNKHIYTASANWAASAFQQKLSHVQHRQQIVGPPCITLCVTLAVTCCSHACHAGCCACLKAPPALKPRVVFCMQGRCIDRVITCVYLPITLSLIGLVTRFPRILWNGRTRILTGYTLFTLCTAVVPLVCVTPTDKNIPW
jgi:hypothetical protein